MNPNVTAQGQPASPPPLLWVVAAMLFLASLLAHLSVMIGPARVVRPDEIYQTLEPAFSKIFGAGVQTWEWRAGLRSWLFPDFLALLMRVAGWLHGGHLFYLTLIWIVMSAIAAVTVMLAVRIGWQIAGWAGALWCGALVGFWPDLVFLGGRTLLEVQSGNMLFLAMGLAMLPTSAVRRWHMLRICAIGCLLGLTLALRVQLAPCVMLIAWWCCRADRQAWLALIAGASAPLLLLGINDWINWGIPYYSVWKNIDFNMIKSGANDFGVSPPRAYLADFAHEWGLPVCAMLLLLFLISGSQAVLPRLAALIIVLSHSLIAHKEFSFIYPGMQAAMLAIGLGAARISTTIVPAGLASPLLLWLNFSMNAMPSWPGWAYPGRGLLPLWVQAGHQPDFCGMVVNGSDVPFAAVGGYVFLGRSDGPIYVTPLPGQLAAAQGAANYVLSDGIVPVPKTYEKIACVGDICMLHRPGGCDPRAGKGHMILQFTAGR